MMLPPMLFLSLVGMGTLMLGWDIRDSITAIGGALLIFFGGFGMALSIATEWIDRD